MPKRKLDLRILPPWLQYLIALIVTAIVVALALCVGHNQPTPVWIENWLVPGLGWLGLFLIMVIVISAIRKRL